jgi:hypothetical protein
MVFYFLFFGRCIIMQNNIWILSIVPQNNKTGLWDKTKMKMLLYTVIIFSQIYFLINFKLQGTFSISSSFQSTPLWCFLTTDIFYILTSLGLLLFYLSSFYVYKIRKENCNCFCVIATCLIFFTVRCFYYIAHQIILLLRDGCERFNINCRL